MKNMNKTIVKLKASLRRTKWIKSGQTLVEYALILAFISVVAIVVLQRLGSKVTSVFSTVNNKLDCANSGS
jgi:Flp pilus assembly pilin Flp